MMSEPPLSQWPAGGGICGGLVADLDWAATSLGPISSWPPHLRINVSSVVNSPIPQVLMWGPDHIMIYNDGYIDIAGNYHPAALGGTVPGIWPEIWDFNRDILERGLRGEVISYREQPIVVNRSGAPEEVIFDLYYTPIYDDDGARVDGVLCTVLEVTQTVAAREALRRSNDRFLAAVDAMHSVLWTNTADGRMEGEQRGWSSLTGQRQDEYQGYGWANAVHPDDRQASIDAWQRALRTRSTYEWEHRVRGRDGAYGVYSTRAVPTMDAAGEIVEWVGVHTDITEQRQSEARLQAQADDLRRQIAHRQRAEDQLRHLNETLEARVTREIERHRATEQALHRAQKMESMGQLTGGVAHDFNNLLQVIAGNLHMLSRDVEGNGRAGQRVDSALAAVTRGAKLASQLLAFGRRQPLEPKVIRPAGLIGDMDELLRRSLGEKGQLTVDIPHDLWNICVDRAHLESALLNLTLNARDAMDTAGLLTIQMSNIRLEQDGAAKSDLAAGDYVMLETTDTGSGMPPEILERIFDPFFSTKPEGQGTGLGLSMVYGFVRQSGGQVLVHSSPGQGTSVRLYLPASTDDEDIDLPATDGPIIGGTETVLVVEDDDGVRATVVDLLQSLGYHVLTANDAEAGLSVIQGGQLIDLLFTDVVMPGTLTSRKMAEQARQLQPRLGVLFTSGYTENSIVHGGRLDTGVELLSKPYSREALARRVRYVLERSKMIPLDHSADEMADRPVSILLVEDNGLIREDTAMMLEDMGHKVQQAGKAAPALTSLEAQPFDLLLTDLGLPDINGNDLAQRAVGMQPGLAVVYATGDSELPANCPRQAVLLCKPYGEADLRDAVAEAMARMR